MNLDLSRLIDIKRKNGHTARMFAYSMLREKLDRYWRKGRVDPDVFHAAWREMQSWLPGRR
jgi:hypothetical protein